MPRTNIMPWDEISDALAQALISLSDTLVFDSKDFSLDKRDAWIYAILVGWGDALEDIAKQFGWNKTSMARLKSYHTAVEKYKTLKRDDALLAKTIKDMREGKEVPEWEEQPTP